MIEVDAHSRAQTDHRPARDDGRSTTDRSLGVIAAALLSAVVFASCTAATTDALRTEPVGHGDTWSLIAVRLADCDDPHDVEAAGRYLREVNPDAAADGLGTGDVVVYDPDLVRAIACDDARPANPGGTGEVVDAGGSLSTTTNPITTSSTGTAPDSTTTTVPTSLAAAAPDPVATGSGAPLVADGEAFVETFEDPGSVSRFQWQLHHGASFGQELFEWKGDHDQSCGAPTTTRDVRVVDQVVLYPDGMGDPGQYGSFVYWCAPKGVGSGHLMTSFLTEGYAQVDLSPDVTFVDVRRVCWNQNQTDLGGRKWTQVVVVPEPTYVANDRRLDYVSPLIADGPGAGGLQLVDDVFLFEMRQGSTAVSVGARSRAEDFDLFVTTDKARRYRTCITDREDGTVEISLERDTSTELRLLEGAFPDGHVRVIFQDDSYNPPKDPGTVEHGFTWHWDDIVVETA